MNSASLQGSNKVILTLVLHLEQFIDLAIGCFPGNCQDKAGGFAGGPGQQAHLAPTYAAVNALCILGTEEAYSIINRKTLQVCIPISYMQIK